LGLRAFGSDLNPVAVLIGKALVEIPPKFAGLPPVNPKSRAELTRGGRWQGKGAQGLAEDVRYYGQWMRDEAAQRIGHFYPKAKLPDGTEATVIAWLWARTVRSPDPSARGAMVPLVSSFMLSTRQAKKAWVELTIDASAQDGWRFEVKTGAISKADEDKFKLGTKAGKGEAFICVLTGSAIERSYVQAEGKADRLEERLMAVVAEGKNGRVFLTPTGPREKAAQIGDEVDGISDAKSSFLSPSTPTRAEITGGVCSAYGLRSWAHLFSSRQLLALLTFSSLVSEARTLALSDASKLSLRQDGKPLRDGGNGTTAYADAIATYLGLACDRLMDRQSSLCGWDSGFVKIRNTFARQGFTMTWDFAEGSPFSESSGNFSDATEWIVKVIHNLVPTAPGSICQISAQDNNFAMRPACFSTDPPYYDNINYSALSDLFYVWARHSIGDIWPDLFRRLSTPKDDELIALASRHGGRSEAEAFFMNGMRKALAAMRTAATDNEPLAIFYAFKQSESAQDGITSAGWASFLQAVVDSGLTIDGTWPMRTELVNRIIGKDANALASSIVLVCRKRAVDAAIVTRAEFLRALKREMPGAIDGIRKAGVGPVDMQQAVIGPGMGVFTRCSKVLESDDSAMSVKTALSLINRVWEEIENELDANFDPETQVALAWFANYGFDVKPSGELTTLANAKNIPDRALFDTGVFKNLHGKTALTKRADLADDWSPVTDRHATVWECVQHTARVLKAPDGGGEPAAQMVAQMGAKAADAQKLAYRLYEISTQKGWSQEALVYNELAQEWAHLEDLAVDLAGARPTEAARQRAFDFDGSAA